MTPESRGHGWGDWLVELCMLPVGDTPLDLAKKLTLSLYGITRAEGNNGDRRYSTARVRGVLAGEIEITPTLAIHLRRIYDTPDWWFQGPCPDMNFDGISLDDPDVDWCRYIVHKADYVAPPSGWVDADRDSGRICE